MCLGREYDETRSVAKFLHRDREWQKWPITIVTGAYLGYVVGKLGGEYLLRGKRIKFDERDALFRP